MKFDLPPEFVPLIPIVNLLISILVFALFVFIVFRRIRRLTNKTTRKYLGMDASQTVKFISDGLRNEATLPKPIANMSAAYIPRIQHDFPEMGYENMEALAKTTLVNFLNAIEADKTDTSFPSAHLMAQLENIINDNRSRGVVEHFDSITVHKAGIAKYNNSVNEASAIFEISVGYIHFLTKDGHISSGSKATPEQAAYKVILTYSQQADGSTDVVFSSSCPSCGAPVSASGNEKKCSFCGCCIKEISQRVWVVSDIWKFS